MTAQNIPVVDLGDWHAGGQAREGFIRTVGESLADIGFFAVRNHGVSEVLTKAAYNASKQFFALPTETKAKYAEPKMRGQRGYTGFGKEHAKDSKAPDLKEFWQVGRPDVADDHPVHREYGANVWPAEVQEFQSVLTDLYRALDGLGSVFLQAAAMHLGLPARTFADMAVESDTIVRVLYYPPVGDKAITGAVRSAAHEDINLITLLSGATSEGLELLLRDGTWMPVHTGFDTIVVDSGDMLQNVTNGFYKSTTHRVVNPKDAGAERFSMPCFIHPRREVDLTPLADAIARTGGTGKFPAISAGQYLAQRLAEIGLA